MDFYDFTTRESLSPPGAIPGSKFFLRVFAKHPSFSGENRRLKASWVPEGLGAEPGARALEPLGMAPQAWPQQVSTPGERQVEYKPVGP